MIFIFTGCLAFVFFYIFDLNKIKFLCRNVNICFAAGIVLLTISTIGVLLGDGSRFTLSLPLKLLFAALSAGSLLLLIYVLFFALPYGKTYVAAERGNTVIDSGMYALCRHPGVIWFFFFYFFLWLASGKMMMMWAGIIWTIMDIVYVFIEDRWFFPKTLNGYDRYKSEVPFLIPTPASIKKFISL